MFIATLLGLSVALIRFTPENSLIWDVSDAQGGIALMFALGVAAFVFLIATPVAYGAIQKKGLLRVVWIVVLGGICAYQFLHAIEIRDTANTLRLAASLNTDPARLSAIGAASRSYHGLEYNIDNRLASNPTTPAPLLITLYHKGRHGTKICLA